MSFLQIRWSGSGTVCFKENCVRQMQRRQEQIHATGVFEKDASSQNISAKYLYKTPLQTFKSRTIGASQKRRQLSKVLLLPKYLSDALHYIEQLIFENTA